MNILRRTLTPAQWLAERQQARNYFLIEAVKKYADYRFTAIDRTFCFALNDDGEKLGHLILAEGSTNRLHDEDWLWLEKIIAVVCSSDDCDISYVPMIYYDEAEAIRAWKELHDVSRVQPNTASQDLFDELLDEEDED